MFDPWREQSMLEHVPGPNHPGNFGPLDPHRASRTRQGLEPHMSSVLLCLLSSIVLCPILSSAVLICFLPYSSVLLCPLPSIFSVLSCPLSFYLLCPPFSSFLCHPLSIVFCPPVCGLCPISIYLLSPMSSSVCCPPVSFFFVSLCPFLICPLHSSVLF